MLAFCLRVLEVPNESEKGRATQMRMYTHICLDMPQRDKSAHPLNENYILPIMLAKD